jgi:glycosyltransferase involved in cell wall biosynthesis
MIAKECYKICEKYGAIVSEYVWQDDFAAARNFNFAQVPKDFDYILWLDADDALREGKLMRELVEANPKDAYAMWYQYDFDAYKRPYIVHQKVRIVRNDGSFSWMGRLHESLTANRQVDTHLLIGCDVLHLSTPAHFEANKERNLRIALRGKEEAPNDPRSYWNTGNAYHGSAQFGTRLQNSRRFLRRPKAKRSATSRACASRKSCGTWASRMTPSTGCAMRSGCGRCIRTPIPKWA